MVNHKHNYLVIKPTPLVNKGGIQNILLESSRPELKYQRKALTVTGNRVFNVLSIATKTVYHNYKLHQIQNNFDWL